MHSLVVRAASFLLPLILAAAASRYDSWDVPPRDTASLDDSWNNNANYRTILRALGVDNYDDVDKYDDVDNDDIDKHDADNYDIDNYDVDNFDADNYNDLATLLQSHDATVDQTTVQQLGDKLERVMTKINNLSLAKKKKLLGKLGKRPGSALYALCPLCCYWKKNVKICVDCGLPCVTEDEPSAYAVAIPDPYQLCTTLR